MHTAIRSIVLIAGVLLGAAAMAGCGGRDQAEAFPAPHAGRILITTEPIFIGPASVWKLGFDEGVAVLLLAAEDYPYAASSVPRPSRAEDVAVIEGERFARLPAGTRIDALPGVAKSYVTWEGRFLMGRIASGTFAGSTVIINELYAPPSFTHPGPYQLDAARARVAEVE